MTVANNDAGAPWWRFPMVWLVIGGPLVVVVASFVTLGLALRYPDPVLSVPAAAADLRSMDDAGKPARPDPSTLPALQARNHAATGGK
ncbi:MAG: hypothetical protein ABI574_08095 [Burkholderiales bacterium]